MKFFAFPAASHSLDVVDEWDKNASQRETGRCAVMGRFRAATPEAIRQIVQFSNIPNLQETSISKFNSQAAAHKLLPRKEGSSLSIVLLVSKSYMLEPVI